MTLLAPLLVALPTAAPWTAPVQEPAADAADRARSVEPAWVEGQVLVRFASGLTAGRRALVLGDRFAEARMLVPKLDLALVTIEDGTSVPEACAAIEGRPGVHYAVPDHLVTERDTFPNDSGFGQQYGKHNTGQTGGTPDADMDCPAAWDHGTGDEEFAVAIVDGGVDHGHPDLVGNRWENAAEVGGTPGVDDDGNGYVDDLYGWNAYSNNGSVGSSSHGTHVAGIAGAQGGNGSGIAGVVWDTKIVSVAGSSGSTSTVMIAYQFVLDQKDRWLATGGAEGAQVVSCNSSFGIDFADCTSGTYAPWNDMYDLMGQSGILNCAATMNNTSNVDVTGDVPTGCSSDWLITVTATNDDDDRTFSAYGQTTIDLGAPGSGIYSTLPGNSYGSLSGTSMATPQMTGAVALLHSNASADFAALRDADPAAAALEIKQILLDTVDVVPTLDNLTVSNGRANLEAAVDVVRNWDDGSLGTRYCSPAPNNSWGLAGRMSVEGSLTLADDDLTLIADMLPPNVSGYFLCSQTQGFVMNPAGSSGHLCLGGDIGRFAAQVGNSGSAQEISIVPDLLAFPTPTGTTAVVAGETWNFQLWHRDMVLSFPTSNFTDAVSVTFN